MISGSKLEEVAALVNVVPVAAIVRRLFVPLWNRSHCTKTTWIQTHISRSEQASGSGFYPRDESEQPQPKTFPC